MKLIQHVWMACIGLCLFSCTQTDELETAQGKTGFIVSLTDGTKLDVSRATPGDIVDSEGIEGADFNLRIVNTETEGEIYNDKVGTEVIKAYSGVYDLTATYGENPVLALDAPYFKGETTGVEVFNGQITQVTIACKVANALVSVTYDNSKASFENVYSNYYVEVKVGSATPVQIDKTGAKSAYMQAGSAFEVIFHGTIDGTDKAVTLGSEFEVPTTLNAGDHLKLTLSPKLDRFDIPLSIEGVNVVEAPLTEEIPMEWLPKPKITGFNEDETNEVTQVETADAVPAVLNFAGSMNIQDVELTLDLKDADYAILNKTYTLSTLSEEDRTALTNAGIVLPTLNEAKAGNIDFTTLAGKLKIASGSEITHNIKLRVKANDRWSNEENSPATYTIKTIAPKITVTAKPEDIWSKSLIVSGITVEEGNETTINGNLKYQFNDNGTWKDCNENNLAMLTDHPSDCKMQVRAIYRGVVECEPTTFDLEVPEQLPNGNMDEWSYETYTGDRFSFNPWADNGTPFWDTSNDFTTRHRYNSGSDTNYNGFHSVSYVIGRGNVGLAAELRSTANGRGNTKLFGHTEQDYNKVAGDLFTGTAKVTVKTGGGMFGDISGEDDTYEQEKNASFPSRPTALTFYYKYAPYNSDTWSVHIELLDENKNVIVQNDKTSSEAKSDWTQESVSLDYVDGTTYAKCKYIYVIFKSTINEGANMPYREITQTFYVLENGSLSPHTYEPAYIGSVLTIDDIELIYDK